MRHNRWLALGGILVALLSGAGCSSDPSVTPAAIDQDSAVAFDAQDSSPDDTAHDASADSATDSKDAPLGETTQDTGSESAADAVSEALEGGPADAPSEVGDPDVACAVLGGLGQVTCACNGLGDAQWNSASPFLFEDHVDFGTLGWDQTQLTAGGLKVFTTPNLGGSSIESETTAYEMLARCDFATLIKTEAEIDYQNVNGKKSDFIVSIDGRKVGVSVVRAYHYPPTNPYTEAEAAALLTKKLSEIPLSLANAIPADAWERSILSVIAWDQQYADMVTAAWNVLDPTLRADVIVVLTVTDGNDTVLY
jgi:hypothetical protein